MGVIRMFTSFNEPSRLEYKSKSSLLFWLNHIPYKGFLFEFFRSKFPRLSKYLVQEEVVVIPRIVEHPLVFRNLELAWKNTRRWMLGKQIVYRTSPAMKSMESIQTITGSRTQTFSLVKEI